MSGCTFQFDETPFSLGEKRTLHCQYGIHYYKSKPHTNDRVFMQGTRKKGCEAHIQIVEFNIYPNFSMKLMISTELSQKRIRIIREDHLKALREIFLMRDSR